MTARARNKAARGARRIALLGALAALGMAVPSVAATHGSYGGGSSSSGTTSNKKPAVKTYTNIHRPRVSVGGTYSVIVAVPASKVASASIYAGSQSQRNVALSSSQTTRFAFAVTVGLRSRTFTVRVVSVGHKVPYTVASSLQVAQPVTPPTPTPTGSTSPTGPAAGPYDTLVWSDEFTGTAGSAPNPLSWTPDSGGGCGDGTLSTNTPNVANASVNGSGDLEITADGPTSTPPYSTAQIDTDGLFSFTYGEIEARIYTPPGHGLCSAFWLLADDGQQLGWPNGGEIDVMEQIGNLPNQTNGFLHGPTSTEATDPNDQQYNAAVNSTTPLAGGWHTYGVIWQANSITWTLDGVPFATATPSTIVHGSTWVYNSHPFHIILDLAVGGWPGTPDSSTVFPASMQVDWVRVYQ